MISFAVAETPVVGEMELPDTAVTHARARRVTTGEPARLLDGQGTVGTGAIAAVEKRRVTVSVTEVITQPRPLTLELLVPVADKDRMLLAAEKCVELQITAWRPVYFERSRSVSPRGEGERFREKVLARMRGALEQSGGAWLPEVHSESEFKDAIGAPREGKRVVLDSRGPSLVGHISLSPMALAIGPEGGITEGELSAARQHGWDTGALSDGILRFETAIIAAAALVRGFQLRR